jgi:chromosome segregation ATPase
MMLKPLRDGVESLLQERSLLEQQLRLIQEHRASANQKLEQVNYKVCQLIEKNTKASESLSMAVQKVDQSQAEIQRVGDLTESNRKKLENLHGLAEEERNDQAKNVYRGRYYVTLLINVMDFCT